MSDRARQPELAAWCSARSLAEYTDLSVATIKQRVRELRIPVRKVTGGVSVRIHRDKALNALGLLLDEQTPDAGDAKDLAEVAAMAEQLGIPVAQVCSNGSV